MSTNIPPECDQDIYKNGRCVAIITGANATVIECFIKEVARATGEPVDWHYVGGRAMVLTTGDVEKVTDCIALRGQNECYHKCVVRLIEPRPNHFALDMDGTYHTKYVETGCCEHFGKTCSCGGWMHYQPVYGGCYYQCEDCKNTA